MLHAVMYWLAVAYLSIGFATGIYFLFNRTPQGNGMSWWELTVATVIWALAWYPYYMWSMVRSKLHRRRMRRLLKIVDSHRSANELQVLREYGRFKDSHDDKRDRYDA